MLTLNNFMQGLVKSVFTIFSGLLFCFVIFSMSACWSSCGSQKETTNKHIDTLDVDTLVLAESNDELIETKAPAIAGKKWIRVDTTQATDDMYSDLFLNKDYEISLTPSKQVPPPISSPKVVNLEELQQRFDQRDDSLYLFNFWATWCKPCVAEMPHFLEMAEVYKDKKLKLILVSLDFPEHFEHRLLPFLEENAYNAEVLLLDEPNPNAWINEISPIWTGAIPATLVIYPMHNYRFMYEQEFSAATLRTLIDSVLANKR